MWDTFILWSFAIFIFGIIAYILWYQLFKYLKGNVKLILPKDVYDYGEMIQWTVEIKAKKTLEVQLVELHLIANKRERAYGDKSASRRYVEVFRQTKQIGDQDTIQAGSTRAHVVWFQIPKTGELPEELQYFLSAQGISKKVQRFYWGTLMRRKLRWNLKVVVRCQGIDLYTRQSLELRDLSEKNI